MLSKLNSLNAMQTVGRKGVLVLASTVMWRRPLSTPLETNCYSPVPGFMFFTIQSLYFIVFVVRHNAWKYKKNYIYNYKYKCKRNERLTIALTNAKKYIQRILLSGYPRDCLKECDQGCLGKLKQEDTLTSVIKIWFFSVQKIVNTWGSLQGGNAKKD